MSWWWGLSLVMVLIWVGGYLMGYTAGRSKGHAEGYEEAQYLFAPTAGNKQ